MGINEQELLEKIKKDYPFLLSSIIAIVGMPTYEEIINTYLKTIECAEEFETSQDL